MVVEFPYLFSENLNNVFELFFFLSRRMLAEKFESALFREFVIENFVTAAFQSGALELLSNSTMITKALYNDHLKVLSSKPSLPAIKLVAVNQYQKRLWRVKYVCTDNICFN